MNTTQTLPFSIYSGPKLTDAEIITKYNLQNNSNREVKFILLKFIHINNLTSKIFPEGHKKALAWADEFSKCYEQTIQVNECSQLHYLTNYIEDQCDGNTLNMLYTYLPSEFATIFAKHYISKNDLVE
jgi:hypothetical protein